MIKKSKRLNFNKFDFFYTKPIKIIESPYFNLIIYKNNTLDNKYGILISKNIIKKAVERNKIKRIFFSEINKYINKELGLIFVIKIKKNISNIEDFKKEINLLFKSNLKI